MAVKVTHHQGYFNTDIGGSFHEAVPPSQILPIGLKDLFIVSTATSATSAHYLLHDRYTYVNAV